MRRVRRFLIEATAGLIWLGVLGVGVGEGQSEAPAPQSVLALEGRRVYRSACAACHGLRGDGEGPAARSINPKPRDFMAGVLKFRSTPSGALPTDSDLFRTISEGVPGTWMPAWEDLLSEKQRWAVVAYLKTLVPDFQFEFAEDSPLPLPSGLPTTASASEGRCCEGLNRSQRRAEPRAALCRGRASGPRAAHR